MRVTLAAVLFAIAFMNPALAADGFVALEGAATSNIDLDTPGGDFSYWVIPNVGSANTLRATFQIKSINQDPKWHPRTQIALISGDETAQLRFGAIGDSTFEVSLVQYKRRELASTQKLGITLKLGEPIEVSMDWTPDGEVIVKVGSSDQYTVALEHPVIRLEITNSSCDAMFEPVALGRSNP